MSDTPKYLLDTNVFRAFAEHQLGGYEDQLLKASKERNPPWLWACDINYQEIVAHINREEIDRFSINRNALKGIDILCCNRGLIRYPFNEVLKAVAIEHYKTEEKEDNVRGINQYRRRMIKVEKYEDIPNEDLIAGEKIATESRKHKDVWVDINNKQTERLIKEMTQEEKGDIQKVILDTVNTFVQMYQNIAKEGGLPAGDESIRKGIKEHLYFHAFLIWKSINDKGYNFKKHETDNYDRWLLVYLSQGFTLMSLDTRLKKNIEEMGCPEPVRIETVEEAVKKMSVAGYI